MATRPSAFRLWRRLVRWVGRLARPRGSSSGRVERGVCFSLHAATVDTPREALPAEISRPQAETLLAPRRRLQERLENGSAFRPLAECCHQGAWVATRIRDQEGRDVARLALWPDEGEPRP